MQVCCESVWQVGEYGTCQNGYKYRTVTNLTSCADTTNRPASSLPCSAITPTVNLTANNLEDLATVSVGDRVNLIWSSTNAVSCSGSSSFPYFYSGMSGSAYENAVSSKTYSVTCYSVDGLSITDSVTVNVITPSVSITVNNSTGPLSLPLYSQPISLAWSTAGGVTNCTASGDWSGTKASSGGIEAVGNFTSTRTYTFSLNCLALGGNVFSSFVVNISATTVDIKINGSDGPIVLSSLSSLPIMWSTNNANSCTASGGTNWTGPKENSGGPEYTEYISTTKIFTLTCKNALGNDVSDSVTVSVPTPFN
jgi:hypothetical protein